MLTINHVFPECYVIQAIHSYAFLISNFTSRTFPFSTETQDPITTSDLDSRIASLADPDPRPVRILLEPLVVFRQTAELELGHGLFVRSGRHCCGNDFFVGESREEVVLGSR